MKRPFPPETQVPEHQAFGLYAPSFTMDVPPGNMRDENTDEYISKIEAIYESVTVEISRRTTSTKA